MIAHVFNSSVVSGPETLVLPALRNLGEETQVIFLRESRLGTSEKPAGSPAAYARSLGLQVREVTVRSRWDTLAFRRLAGTFRRLRPDVIHAHDVKASLYALKAARRSGQSPYLVSTHHGTAARPGLKLRLYEEYYVRRILPSYHAVCCVCEGDRQSLRARGLAERKLYLHPNGIDRPEVSGEARAQERRSHRDAWGLSAGREDQEDHAYDDALLIGAVARLSVEKRHDLMLLALKAALGRWQGAPLRLVCFGTGAEQARLIALTRELGLERNVLWMGYRGAIGREMAGFDLLLSLSSGEGLPISVLEAGWAGTPVFSTAVGGIPGVLDEGRCGWLIDPGASPDDIASKLVEVCEDRARLQSTGARFQSRVKSRYSESAWLNRLREIYAERRP